MKRFIATITLLFTAQGASAIILDVGAEWEAQFAAGSPVTNFSGNFTGVFDTDAAPANRFTLTSLFLDPVSQWATPFDVTNSFFFLASTSATEPGNFNLQVGGSINGGFVIGGTDDFGVFWSFVDNELASLNVLLTTASPAFGAAAPVRTTRNVFANPRMEPDPTPVPEPGTLALLGAGLLALGISRRRRNSTS